MFVLPENQNFIVFSLLFVFCLCLLFLVKFLVKYASKSRNPSKRTKMSSENETETTDTTNNDEPTLKDVMKALQSSANREKEIKLTLNKIESRLVSLEVLKATVIDVEKSQKFLSGQCKDLETKVNTVDKNKILKLKLIL